MNVATKKLKTTGDQGLRSRYEYKKYWFTDDGKRIPIDALYFEKRTADLINTCIFNPKKSTYTLYMLQFDLDFDKVRDARFINDGKISWSAVQNYIAEHHSYLFQNIFSATRSHSGRGLSIGLSISPIELKSENSEKCERLARAVERKIQQAFMIAGCGVDRGATGLKRLCANWKNPAKREYWAPHVKRFNERKGVRPSALKDLIKELNQDPLLAYQKKRDQLDELLCHDIRAEKGLSKLYLHLLDEHYTAQMSTKEVAKLTGLTEKTALKHLKSGFKWLSTDFISKFEGWSLTLNPEHKLSARAFSLSELSDSNKKNKPANQFEFVEAKHPELVEPGERNQQITGWLLRLKWLGIEESEATNRVEALVEQIPGHESSTNCRSVSEKAASLYRHQQDTFNCQAQVDYPEWLSTNEKNECGKLFRSTEGGSLLKEVSVLPFSAEVSNILEEKFPIFEDFSDLIARELHVGPDQHFQFRAKAFTNRAGKKQWRYSFYSVPRWFKTVLVFERDHALYVFAKDSKEFICQHKLRNTPNKYITIDDHLSLGVGKSYVDWISRKAFVKPRESARWRSMLEVDGYQAIRKIQQEFRTLSKVEGEVQ